MADIEIDYLFEAKEGALRVIKELENISSELEFLALCVIFAQLMNTVMYKVVGEMCKLTGSSIESMCRDSRIKRLFKFRLIAAHLYDTIRYDVEYNKVVELFGYDDFYSKVLSFMKEVALSVENGSFESKYGTAKNRQFSSLNALAGR